MDRLLRLLRSLGPAGATANAAHLQLQRRREDFAVRSLARRLESASATVGADAAVAADHPAA